jgi:hypothetical protein
MEKAEIEDDKKEKSRESHHEGETQHHPSEQAADHEQPTVNEKKKNDEHEVVDEPRRLGSGAHGPHGVEYHDQRNADLKENGPKRPSVALVGRMDVVQGVQQMHEKTADRPKGKAGEIHHQTIRGGRRFFNGHGVDAAGTFRGFHNP